MKLFDKFKKTQEVTPEQTTAKEPVKEPVIAQEVQERKDEESEAQNPDFWMVVQDVFELKDERCLVVGTVAGGIVHIEDEVILRKIDGTKRATKVIGMELDGKFKVLAADPGMPVALLLEGLKKSDISKGDRIISALAEDMEEKVRNAEVLYTLFDERTSLPFVGMHCGEVYTKKEYAENAAEHYKEAFGNLSVKEVPKSGCKETGGLSLFAYFYYLGLEDAIVDNGVIGIVIKREEVLPAPDWSNLPKIKVPVTNPDLRFKINSYLSEVRNGIMFEGKKEMLKQQENDAIAAMRDGRYLIPMKSTGAEKTGENEMTFKEGGTISLALMSDRQGRQFQPLFTDWLEFEKVYDKNEWGGMMATFKEGVSIGYQHQGIVINPLGENMTIEKETIKHLFEDLVEE